MAFTIAPAAPHELLPALRLLFPIAADQAGDFASRLPYEPISVFVARDSDGRIRGSVMVQAIPGALGVAWPPLAASETEADELACSACRWLRERGVKVCQAFILPAELPAALPLQRHGFRHITRLVSMQRQSDADGPSGAIEFERVTPPFPRKFIEVLISTHAGSFDCPELDGARTEDELAAGYGELALSRCFLARSGGAAVGVVMLSPGADASEQELAYMALVPAARGRGIGHELIRFALAEAARNHAGTLTLAVDSRNEPALRVYRKHGFRETGAREVFLAHFSSG